MERFPHPISTHEPQGSVGVFTPSLCHAPLQEIRSWVHDVEELGLPHFGEFAQRLGDLRAVIVRGSTNPAQSSICLCEGSQGTRDTRSNQTSGRRYAVCSMILQRLDDMISTLRSEEDCFITWQAASRSFEEICQLIESADRPSQALP